MDHARQGDLLFIRIGRVPTNVKANPKGRVLAEGEATGHHHSIALTDLSKVNVFLDENGEVVVEARDTVSVEHQEHDTVVLPEGVWKVRIQQEYEPEGWRRVAD